MHGFLFVLMFLASTATAQTYPEYRSTTVNDLAGLLDPADEAALTGQLTGLRRDTGVEMTVVTLATQADFAPGRTLEQFATGLFDHWGIGQAGRNDGVLVLILRDDRAMRVELGQAYGRDWDGAAQRVVDGQFLPAFKAGSYARGILTGSTAVIDDIILPFRAGQDAPAGSKRGVDPLWLFCSSGRWQWRQRGTASSAICWFGCGPARIVAGVDCAGPGARSTRPPRMPKGAVFAAITAFIATMITSRPSPSSIALPGPAALAADGRAVVAHRGAGRGASQAPGGGSS